MTYFQSMERHIERAEELIEHAENRLGINPSIETMAAVAQANAAIAQAQAQYLLASEAAQ